MMKWWLRATASTAAIIAFTQAANADPISVAILTTIGISATASAVAVTTYALTTAASVGLSFLSTVLTQKSTNRVSGVQTEVQMGGDVPRQIPMGICRVAGQFIYFCGVGNKNKELHLVFALADWECAGLNGVYVDDELKTLNSVSVVGTEDARYQVDGYGVNLIVKFFRGSATQLADSELVSAAGGRNTGLGDWTSDHRGAGMCYVSLKLTFSEDLFEGGIPDFEWVLRGAKLYDRRGDSSVGGSGSQDWDDPTTWVFSENPVVMEENFRRGFYRNGVKICGMGIPVSDLLTNHYVAAANICDEAVTEGSETVDRYRCSVIVNDDAEWRVPVETFMSSCAGMLLEKGGLFGPIAGASQSIVETFTTDDLILGYETTFSAKLPRSELFNAVLGSYTNANENWQSDSFPPVTNSGWEAQDNNERLTLDLQLPQVTSAYQASRLAKITAQLGRKQARHIGVYGPKFSAIEAGDWVTLENRFDDYTMQIVSKAEVAPLLWRFEMTEIGADVFGDVATAPTIPPVVPEVIPPHTTTITGFAVEAVSIAGAGGQVRPGIRVTWTPPNDPSVVAVRIEFRIQGTTEFMQLTHGSPLDGQYTIQSDLLAGTTYEVRARYVLSPDLTSTWSAWLAVLTTSSYIVATSKIAADTQEYFNRLQQEIEGEGLGVLAEALERFKQDSNTRFMANSSTTTLGAALDTSIAEVKVQMSALASADTAFAELLFQVSAIAGGSTANGAFKMEAVAAEGGATASIAAFVSADNGVSYQRAGWRLDVYDSGGGLLKGRMVVEADQFAINVTGTPVVPFAVLGPDTFINRVIINDEILSDNYAVDGAGNPAAGFRLGDDGKVRAEDARFTDFQARGSRFTERPIVTDQPVFRNGVQEGLPAIRQWVSPGVILWSPALAWLNMTVFNFHRTPDVITGSVNQFMDLSDILAFQDTVAVPVGKRVPAVLPLSLAGNVNVVELRENGSVVRIQYTGNGAINQQNTAFGKWMFSAERDPLNLEGSNKIVAGLGFARRPFPIVVPEFLADGVTLVTSIAFKVWGAGGGKDDAAGQGGPGGYVAGTFAVGDKSSSSLIKRGDVIWLIAGEGGKTGSQDVVLGYGGKGQSQQRRSGGGGLSGAFIHSISIANMLLCAGGGGGAENGQSGGPGGAAGAGGNGASGTDDAIMTGLPWTFDGTNSKAGGGGGRVGGGWLPAVSNRAGGRGGTNFIRAGATSTTSSASAASANGNATTSVSPNTGDADFIANKDCLGNAAQAAQGKTSNLQPEMGGSGLVVVTYA